MRGGSGIAQDTLGDVVKYGNSEMIGYAVKNQEPMYGVLGAKDKLDLISSGAVAKMPVPKTEEGAEPNPAQSKFVEDYNNFADTSNLRRELLETANLEPEEAFEIRANFMKEQLQYSPKWFAAAMQNQSENRDFVNALNGEYVSRLGMAMAQNFMTKENKLDEAKVIKFADSNHKLQISAEEKNPLYFSGLQNFAYNSIVMQKQKEEAEKAKQTQQQAA
jgi:hypothetical protein